MKRSLLTWLAVLTGLLLVAGGAGALVWAQGNKLVGGSIAITGGILALLWIAYGLLRCWEYRWAKVYGSLGLSLLAAIFFASIFYVAENRTGMLAVGGMWSMLAAFVIGLWLIRLILSAANPVIGIARTVVDEAIRMKVALIFIVALFVIFPCLPIVLDPAERLDYRIKFFLTWSTSLTAMFLSLMTVFIACSTICNELYYKQIFLTMTKPVSRLQYLGGKWLGIMMLNLLLLTVAGGGIYTFAYILKDMEATSMDDRVTVDEQVFVARTNIGPLPPDDMDFNAMLQTKVERVVQGDPAKYPDGKITPKGEDEIRNQLVSAWHSIPPRGSQTFVFGGVTKAKDFGEKYVQLRFKPKMASAPSDDIATLLFRLNGQQWPIVQGMQMPVRVAVDNYHILDLPIAAADEDGNLVVQITNWNIQQQPGAEPYSSVTFSPGKDLEVLYRVGTFEGNFIRSMLLIWLQLACIAMLALTAGTFLGFPVACLLTFMVFFVAGSSEYVAESLRYYAGSSTQGLSARDFIGEYFRNMRGYWEADDYWKIIKLQVRMVGEFFLMLVPSFSTYNPIPYLTDGRNVSWGLVGQGAVMIGLVWTLICAAIGWFIFRIRELARVIV